MARIIGEVRPAFVWVENSPRIIHRGVDVVIEDLSALGYDAKWGIVSAQQAGAPHGRPRWWCIAVDPNAVSIGLEARERAVPVVPSQSSAEQLADTEQREGTGGVHWWCDEPSVGGVAHGLATRVDGSSTDESVSVERLAKRPPFWRHRLMALGNGQVPAAMCLAWDILHGGEEED